MENLGFTMNLEKSDTIPKNDTFDTGKKKEDEKGSPQSYSSPGNSETSNVIKRPVFKNSNCNMACFKQVDGASNRNKKRPKEAQLQLKCAFPTLSTKIDRPEVVGHSTKPLKLVSIDAETLKSKRARICYNRWFWNRLGNMS
ncbi:hypothetical protein AYI70_g8370 [Smittium culicis]|uniref:Uncharacterized protein n=1 Tax=Smittium culicis TaxID=133412 RepID=A0A1R1XG87_9FUNG|nr:hypothetical protein AYI70_g8370 [Smittium culicis]